MRVAIYQPNNPTFMIDENKTVYDKAEYHEVYKFNALPTEDSMEDFLETLFDVFNIGNKPKEYKGHSLSVGDIVTVEGDAYICASCGWEQVKWGEK